MNNTNLEKLRKVLAEIFQLDQADLDFGIYRIMNQKRDEIVRFLDNDLLPQVKEAFSQYRSADRSVIEAEIARATEQAHALGVNPEETAKVKELRATLAGSSVDIEALENEVFSHLTSFFRRYYNEGDFISLRRYKEGVYAIPYEGEEVKLHWANADQYYVKSSETFRDYTFRTQSGKRVRVHLVAASTEQDNNKAAPGKERRFVLCDDKPLTEESGELYIRFEYRPSEGKEKQDDLNQQAIDTILKTPGFDEWVRELAKPAPTDKKKDRTVLEKHLAQYTARNTFDYFVHKDLGGFLRRELDFYIKNEVMHLDDIENESAPKVEQYLSLIKVIRKIAGKIIQFLEQLENFQKKLWLKKKFVIETNYCITLDRVPEDLYPEIAANDPQREEWVRLFAIDEIKGDLAMPGYSEPLTVQFLRANDKLLVDTKFFDVDFRDRLLASIEGLDEKCDGVLMHSENFQALELMQERFKRSVTCIYIDPPYNTDASEILYKNNYKNSSWLSFLEGRLNLSRPLLADDGILCVTIDDFEFHRCRFLLESIYGKEQILGVVAIKNNPSGRSTAKGFSIAHEYAIFIANNENTSIGRLTHSESQQARYKFKDDQSAFEWVNFRKHGGANANRWARPKLYYPIFVSNRETLRFPKVQWNPQENTWLLLEQPREDERIVYPITTDGSEKTWKWGLETARSQLNEFMVRPDQAGELGVYRKARINEAGTLPLTIWDKKEYSSTEYGTNLLKRMFGESEKFSFPKSFYATSDSLRVARAHKEGVILDFFGGSATTAHSVIALNREDEGNRRYLLVETASYFDDVAIPRTLKAAYSREWKDGKPVSRDGVSHMLKYLCLESYEDALNNLEMKRTTQQDSLLAEDSNVREQYLLSYMIDVESRGSQSLLNLDGFRDPGRYKLKVERNGETQLVNVDLVETFNWLLGLTVKHIDVIRGIRVVEGTRRRGNGGKGDRGTGGEEKALVLWRNLDETDNDKLDQWFEKQGYSTRDLEYDLVYVNGDNNLENLRRPDQTWKVRLIEEEFQRLMFDVQEA
jgi:adenine-specific DNA-methyltransferase